MNQRKVIAMIERLGGTVENRSKHFLVRDRNGRCVTVLPHNPQSAKDPARRTVVDLRNAGLWED